MTFIDSLLTRPVAEWPVTIGDSTTVMEQLPLRTIPGTLPPQTIVYHDVVVGVMLVVFVVLSLTLYHNFHYAVVRFKEFFSTERKFSKTTNLPAIGEVRNTLLLTTVSCLCLGLIFAEQDLHLEAIFSLHYSFPMLMVFVAMVFMAHLFLKGLLYSVINWVFFSPEKNREWNHSYFFLTSIFAYLIFPVTLVDVFAHYNFKNVSFCLLFLLLLYKILLFFKLSVNFRAKKHGYVLIFLYFCTVELVPLLMIWHFLDIKGVIHGVGTTPLHVSAPM
jgi:hypothetical protein